MISPVARNYARAFINVFAREVTRDTIDNLKQTIDFLQKHRRAAFLLNVPTIKPEIKRKGIQELCARFKLPASFHRLFDVLLDHRRGYLLLQVLKGIVEQFNKVHDIVTITIESSCALSDGDKKGIEAFAKRSFTGIKEYEYITNPELIAGLKISSGTLLWEQSIQKYMRACAQTRLW